MRSRPAGDPRGAGVKAIREALSRVPLANPPQALCQLDRILDELLAAPPAPGDRGGLVLDLAGPVRGLDMTIGQQLGGEAHPLPAAAAERATAAQRLAEKFADNAALALHGLCAPAGKVPLLKGRLVANLAVAGLLHGGRALQWAYRQYRAPPAGLWRRLHALYLFALEAGQADQPSTAGGVVGVTARTAYRAALLLAAADPYRFSGRELRQAVDAIAAVADRCGLTAGAEGGIRVDVTADAGPVLARGASPDGDSGRVLALDATPAIQAFGGQDAAHAGAFVRPDGARGNAGAWLLRSLAAGWERAARGRVRLPGGYALDLVVGMHALHRALAGAVDFAAFLRQARDDVIAVGPQEQASGWIASGEAVVPATLRAEVLDQSLDGYRLRVGVDDGARLRIGEVVGLAPGADPGDPQDWMVGVLRWLRIEDTRVLLGVKLLHRAARAAAVRVVRGDGEALPPQRAVELPDAEGAGGIALLVTSPMPEGTRAVEVLLPPLASDWMGAGTAGTWRRGATEVLGSACFRVTLLADLADEVTADA